MTIYNQLEDILEDFEKFAADKCSLIYDIHQLVCRFENDDYNDSLLKNDKKELLKNLLYTVGFFDTISGKIFSLFNLYKPKFLRNKKYEPLTNLLKSKYFDFMLFICLVLNV